MNKQIYFVTGAKQLREMAYGDTVYAWLLLHSHYNPDEDHNYIYQKDFTYEMIAKDIGRTRQTVSKRLDDLLNSNEIKGSKDLIWKYDKDVYIMPCFRDFQKLDAETVLNLFRLTSEAKRREELVKTYAWLLKKFSKNEKEISYTEVMREFGYTSSTKQIYGRFKDIFTTLQGAGLIKFRTDKIRQTDGKFGKTLYVYKVNRKASKDWLDKK